MPRVLGAPPPLEGFGPSPQKFKKTKKSQKILKRFRLSRFFSKIFKHRDLRVRIVEKSWFQKFFSKTIDFSS